MDDLEKIIANKLKTLKAIGKRYKDKLQSLYYWNAALEVSNNYYYKVENGKRIYLGRFDGPNCDEIKYIQMHHYLKEVDKRIENNCRHMEKFLKHYKSIEPEDVNADLPRAYRLVEGEEYKLYQPRRELSYEKSCKHPEHLIHRTLKGELVRSKSELIIANMLFSKGIQYRYEEVIEVGDEIIAPDFRIYVERDERFKILEHCGMIGKPQYRDKYLWKLNLYIEEGYMPWRDVFFTYDFLDGEIDSQWIESIIDRFFV